MLRHAASRPRYETTRLFCPFDAFPLDVFQFFKPRSDVTREATNSFLESLGLEGMGMATEELEKD